MTQKCFLVTIQDIKELLLLRQVTEKVTTQTHLTSFYPYTSRWSAVRHRLGCGCV